MSRLILSKLNVLVVIVSTQVGCAPLAIHSAPSVGAASDPSERTVSVRLPVEQRSHDGIQVEQQFLERTFKVKPSTRAELNPLRRPASVRDVRAWRPLRCSGPFHSGSDMQQIQIRLHGHSAEWFYNNYFATFEATDSDALNIFKEYYRVNIGDVTSRIVLPANAPGVVLPNVPAAARKAGVARDVQFALQEVAYSDRYGGSIRLRFELTDIPLATRPEPEPENFDYEFARDRENDASPSWLFDTNDISMVLFVRPSVSLINPKQNRDFTVETFAEFEVRSFIAYRDGVAQPTGSGRDELDRVLAAIAARIPTSLDSQPTSVRPHHSVFAHAWVHNQHFGLIGFDNKVTQLHIGDSWSDPITTAYRPVIFASWRLLSLSDAEADEFLGEGDEEWRLTLNVFREFEGVSIPTKSKKWTVEENRATSYNGLVGTEPGDECTFNQNLKLILRVTDVDPWNPDDQFWGGTTLLALDCELLNQLTGPGWQQDFSVFGAILPVDEDSSSLNGCSAPTQLSRRFCLGAGGILVGSNTFVRAPGPGEGTSSTGIPDFPITVARAIWEAKVAILAR